MPKYILPATEKLLECLVNLRKKYSKANNSDRITAITLLEAISLSGNIDVVLGACIFVLESIRNEYGWFSPTNSTLFNLLNAALNIHENNVLDDVSRFTYLVKFLKYLNTYKTSVDNSTFIETEKLEQITKLVFARINDSFVTSFLKGTPQPKEFLKLFKECPEWYSRNCKKLNLPTLFGGHNTDRDNMCLFIQVLDQHTAENQFALRYAAFLLCLLMIEKEYAALSPTGSNFYKYCSQAMNIKHSSELNAVAKTFYLGMLLNAISAILLNQEQILKWEKAGVKIDFLKILQSTLTKEIGAQDCLKGDSIFSPRLSGYIEDIESYATQCGVTIALTGMSQYIMSNAAISLAPALLVPEYFVTMAVLLYLQKQCGASVISMASSRLTPWIKPVIETPFYLGYKTYDQLRSLVSGLEKKLEPLVEKSEFLQGLLDAPESIFSDDKKKVIKLLHDLPPPEEKPLYTLTTRF